MSVGGTANRIFFCPTETSVVDSIVVPIGVAKLPELSESCTSKVVPKGNPA